MVLGYSQGFGDGTPTLFREKIQLCDLMMRESETWSSSREAHELQPKLHSMREDMGRRWDNFSGNIQHVYGNRTKAREQFLENRFWHWQGVQMLWLHKVDNNDPERPRRSDDKSMMVIVNGRVLDAVAVKTLAVNDGFPDLQHFEAWFDHDFTGKIIHWTNLRY